MAPTASTTETAEPRRKERRRRHSRKHDRSPRYLAIGMIAFGVAISVGAAPRLNAAIDRLDGDEVVKRLATRQPVDPADLDLALTTRRRARADLPQASTLGDIALIRLVQARAFKPNSRERQAALDEAIALTREALAHEPGSSFLWMRLAEAEVQRSGLAPRAAAALRQSLRTGPWLSGLSFPRLELAFLLLPQMDEETRALVQEQVRVIAGWKPDRLAESTRRRYAMEFVRDALASDEPMLAAFDRAWGELR